MVELLAKLSDENAKVFRLIGTRGSPDGPQQGLVSHDAASVLQEQEEQIEFLWSEMDFFSANDCAMGVAVDVEVALGQNRRGLLGTVRVRATELYANAG